MNDAILDKDSLKESLNTIHSLLKDRLIRELLKRSNMTELQLEVLLIHFTLENLYPGKFSYEEKGLLCRKKLSRGAFYRSLNQAVENVIEATYTIVLLGYLGLFETPGLQPLLDLSDALKHYRQELASDANLEALDKSDIEILLKKLVATINNISSKLLVRQQRGKN